MKAPTMTDEEAKAMAGRTYAAIQASPELKLLVDWLHEMPGTEIGLMMIFDCVGMNIEEYEKFATEKAEKQ